MNRADVERQKLLNRLFVFAVFFVIFPALNYYMFFEVYRSIAFNTIPNDKYQDLIAYWAGDAPSGYKPQIQMLLRPLSAFVVIPFYEWMPSIPLRLLPATTDISYVRSSAAIAAVVFICTHLTSFVTFLYARTLARGVAVSVVGGLLVLPMIHITRIHTLDSIAVLLIAVTFALWRKPYLQALVLLFSTFTNEKVLIVVGVVYFLRAIARYVRDRRVFASEFTVFIASIFGFAVYLVCVFLVQKHAGVIASQSQFNPDLYLGNFIDSIGLVFSMKGAMQIGLPVGLLAFLFWCAGRVENGLHRIEILSPFLLLLIACISDVRWNIGFIVFLAFVVPLPFFAEWIVSRLDHYRRMAAGSEGLVP